MAEVVCCADCAWFTRDMIGGGDGIGSCHKISEYRAMNPGQRAIDKAYKQLGGKPCWPNAGRFCDKFEVADVQGD